MTHLLLFNGQLACGASLGPWSNFIQLVDCEKCLAWHKANDFAKSLVTITLPDFDQLVRLFAIMDAVEDGANVGG